MAARASWKGFLTIGDVSVPIAIYAAASTAERVTFHTLNRKTANRLKRQFVDSETGKPVADEDEVKGYETGDDDYILIDPDDIAAAIPENDHRLAIETFIPLEDVDDLFYDRPYFLAPSDKSSIEDFTLLRDALKAGGVAALAEAVLFRRVRHMLIRPEGNGLLGVTLNFDYEVRSPGEVFDEIPEIEIKDEMLELARHIIDTKAGTFDPSTFDDRYDSALAEVVKAKIEGRKISKPKPPEPGKVVDLMAALRESAGVEKPRRARKSKAKAEKSGAGRKGSQPRKKAG